MKCCGSGTTAMSAQWGCNSSDVSLHRIPAIDERYSIRVAGALSLRTSRVGLLSTRGIPETASEMRPILEQCCEPRHPGNTYKMSTLFLGADRAPPMHYTLGVRHMFEGRSIGWRFMSLLESVARLALCVFYLGKRPDPYAFRFDRAPDGTNACCRRSTS